MKRIVRISLALFCAIVIKSTSCYAQGGVRIWKGNTSISVYTNDVDSLVFFDAEEKTDATKYVDLGLSVKWASCNLGAAYPEEYGVYFSWGEIKTKTEYSSESYNCTTFQDAATARLGEGWRMPTDSEVLELMNKLKTEWQWTDNYKSSNVKGYIITSKVSGYEGNSIFLPAAGHVCGKEYHENDGQCHSTTGSVSDPYGIGFYWTKDSFGSNTALDMSFTREGYGDGFFYTWRGSSIRPVHE